MQQNPLSKLMEMFYIHLEPQEFIVLEYFIVKSLQKLLIFYKRTFALVSEIGEGILFWLRAAKAKYRYFRYGSAIHWLHVESSAKRATPWHTVTHINRKYLLTLLIYCSWWNHHVCGMYREVGLHAAICYRKYNYQFFIFFVGKCKL